MTSEGRWLLVLLLAASTTCGATDRSEELSDELEHCRTTNYSDPMGISGPLCRRTASGQRSGLGCREEVPENLYLYPSGGTR